MNMLSHALLLSKVVIEGQYLVERDNAGLYISTFTCKINLCIS